MQATTDDQPMQSEEAKKYAEQISGQAQSIIQQCVENQPGEQIDTQMNVYQETIATKAVDTMPAEQHAAIAANAKEAFKKVSEDIGKVTQEKAGELQEASNQKLQKLDELTKEANSAWEALFSSVNNGK